MLEATLRLETAQFNSVMPDETSELERWKVLVTIHGVVESYAGAAMTPEVAQAL